MNNEKDSYIHLKTPDEKEIIGIAQGISFTDSVEHPNRVGELECLTCKNDDYLKYFHSSNHHTGKFVIDFSFPDYNFGQILNVGIFIPNSVYWFNKTEQSINSILFIVFDGIDKSYQKDLTNIAKPIYGGTCTKCLKDYPDAEITSKETFKCWSCRNGY